MTYKDSMAYALRFRALMKMAFVGIAMLLLMYIFTHENNVAVCVSTNKSWARASCIRTCTCAFWHQYQNQYKDHLFRYGDFHYEVKTVVRTCYLYDRNPCVGKTTSSYGNGPHANRLTISIIRVPYDSNLVGVTHRGRATHICVTKLGHNWLR